MPSVYCTKNKINGKKYIGSDTKDRTLEEYPGSGKLLRYAIKKYGIENFEKTILESCDLDSLREREEYWLKCLDVANSDEYYNIVDGYRGGKTSTSFKKGEKRDFPHSRLGKPAWNKGMSGERFSEAAKKGQVKRVATILATNKTLTKEQLQKRYGRSKSNSASA